jgi:hypothetical protein
MRYKPRRNYLHPVLRPLSNDYPKGSIATKVSAEIKDGELNLAMTFDVSEPSVQEQIRSGKAVCAAMLYCGSTLYRQMLSAGVDSTEFSETISSELLHGNVELHPAVILNTAVAHPTETAHPEYGSQPVDIERWRPLAVDAPWHFQVNPDVRPTKGIFNLEKDGALPEGQFDIKVDTTERYITITANEATLSQFKAIANDESRALPTVYVSALASALAYVKNLGEDDGSIAGDGWVNCIRNNLKRHKIDIGDRENDGDCSLFRAAQILLENPFGKFLAAACAERESHGAEDDC